MGPGAFYAFIPWGAHFLCNFWIPDNHLLLEEIREFGNVSLPLFYARRALRILPAFLLFVGALVVLNHFAVIKLPPGDLLAVLTYTVNFSTRSCWYSGHLWSLSVEEQFYFLWPFAVCFLPRRSWTSIALLAFFSNIGFGVFHRLFGIRLFGLNPAVLAFAFPFVCGPIAIGCLLAIWEKPIRQIGRRLLAHPAGISLIPLILIADTFSIEPIRSAGLDLLLALFVARCVFHPQDIVGQFLNLGLMRFIGKLSYSLYLWQQLFFHYSFLPMFPLNVIGTAGLASASLSRKTVSKTTLKPAQERYYSPKRPELRLCIVGNDEDTFPGASWLRLFRPFRGSRIRRLRPTACAASRLVAWAALICRFAGFSPSMRNIPG